MARSGHRARGSPRAGAAPERGYRATMTTDPYVPRPGEDPDVVPSGDPEPIPTEPLPDRTPPGEEPDVNPPHDPEP
jgi:hypothetical protein